MTYDDAVRMLKDDYCPLVRRPHWDMLRAVAWDPHDSEAQWFNLDNYDGMRTGMFGPFHPSSDDLVADDWIVYTPPTSEEIEEYDKG